MQLSAKVTGLEGLDAAIAATENATKQHAGKLVMSGTFQFVRHSEFLQRPSRPGLPFLKSSVENGLANGILNHSYSSPYSYVMEL
jgi:hypothetical protein